MKLEEVHGTADYNRWIREVRKLFPNATITGSEHQAQMVDWSSNNNEVAGDWESGKGVIYKPGSLGKVTVLEIP